MTIELVTLAQVNDALRLNLEGDLSEPSADDGDDSRFADIQLKIKQATDIIMDYLDLSEDSYSGWTPETVPGPVSASIILAVKSLYDDPGEAKRLADLDKGEGAIASLLRRLRDPAMA